MILLISFIWSRKGALQEEIKRVWEPISHDLGPALLKAWRWFGINANICQPIKEGRLWLCKRHSLIPHRSLMNHLQQPKGTWKAEARVLMLVFADATESLQLAARGQCDRPGLFTWHIKTWQEWTDACGWWKYSYGRGPWHFQWPC